jgi:hypothetical protein
VIGDLSKSPKKKKKMKKGWQRNTRPVLPSVVAATGRRCRRSKSHSSCRRQQNILVGMCFAVAVDELRRGAAAAAEEGECSGVDDEDR